MVVEIDTVYIFLNLLRVPFAEGVTKLALWIFERYGSLYITSGYREGDSGVHGTIPCRGLDLRSRVYEDPDEVTANINIHWTYDPYRLHKQCALFHDTGLGPHIHLQTHPNTVVPPSG